MPTNPSVQHVVATLHREIDVQSRKFNQNRLLSQGKEELTAQCLISTQVIGGMIQRMRDTIDYGNVADLQRVSEEKTVTAIARRLGTLPIESIVRERSMNGAFEVALQTGDVAWDFHLNRQIRTELAAALSSVEYGEEHRDLATCHRMRRDAHRLLTMDVAMSPEYTLVPINVVGTYATVGTPIGDVVKKIPHFEECIALTAVERDQQPAEIRREALHNVREHVIAVQHMLLRDQIVYILSQYAFVW